MPLSPKARRAAEELQAPIREGRTHDVLALIQQFGLSAGDRIAVCEELDRPAPGAVVGLRFDQWDRAGVRTVGDVWRDGRLSK